MKTNVDNNIESCSCNVIHGEIVNKVKEKLPKDEILSKYRHLTLRHPEYLDELLFRSSFYYSIRNHMHDYGFKEIETPVLTRSSPEVHSI